MRFHRPRHGALCKECPLRGSRVVDAIGPNIASSSWNGLVLVGESPGSEEDRKGEPFVGPTGSLLSGNLRNAGLIRERAWLTNLISCRPPHNDLDSPEGRSALECCRPGLEAEIEYLEDHGARVYVPLGTKPLLALGVEGGITLRRGYVYEREGLVLVPTFHPSFLLRGNFEEIPTTISDLRKASRLARDGWTPPRPRFNTHPTLRDIETFSKRVLASRALLALDIETTSLIPERGEILVVGLAESATSAISIPFLRSGGARYWSVKEFARVKTLLARVLATCPVVIHNATYDMAFLRAKGLPVGNLAHDTLLLSHAIHPELKHRLSYVASVYADIPYWKDTLEDKEAATLALPDTALREYNLWDCVVLHMILPDMERDARTLGVWDTYTRVSLPLVEPVMEMTRVGVGFDREAQRRWARDLKKRTETLEEKLRTSFSLPPGFNLASGPHLTYLVYGDVPPGLERALDSYRARTLEIDILTRERDDLKARAEAGLITTKKEASRLVSLEGQVIRKAGSAVFNGCRELSEILSVPPLTLPSRTPRKRTEKGGVSLDDEAIQGILIRVRARIHEIALMKRPPKGALAEREGLARTEAFLSGVLDLREVSKMSSTYGDFETWSDGRVHFPFKMAGTATGRLSSGDKKSLGVGNGQNIPKDARRLFVAPPGSVILGADYASLEPRMIAYLSGDNKAIEDFDSGIKVYDAIIRDTLGIPKDHPSYKDIRDAIKVYVLGTNYGGGLEGVFKQMGVKCRVLPFSLRELKALHERRLDLHPELRAWTERTIREVQATRVLKNAFGRRRVFLGPRSNIAREALDYGPQSSGADLVNMVMIRLHARLHSGTKTPSTSIILQLHDALYLESPLAEAREAARALVEEMERPVDVGPYKGVVFPVELSWGRSWGEMKDVGGWKDVPKTKGGRG